MGSLEIVTFQEDALANHFLMTIPTFPGVTDLVDTNIRVTSVDIPDTVIETYTITKGGRKLTRPSGIVGNPNEITLNYRIDKYMKVYKGFNAWKELIQNSLTGIGLLGDALPVTGGPSQYRVPITVQTFAPDPKGGSDGVPLGTSWLFLGAYPSSHGAFTFDEESGDPLTASLTLQFIDFVPPIL